ncbi:MAG TPA: DUF3422 family protein [Allosphingosinicella sp.]|nr:DUF3422 family protein [Allosphingosinicella sp.]
MATRAVLADQAIAELYRHLRTNLSSGTAGVVDKITTNSEIEFEGRTLVILFGSAMDGATGAAEPCPASIRPDSYRTIKIGLLWHGLRTTLSFELHTEFLVLTVVIDASRKEDGVRLATDRAAEGSVCAELDAGLRTFCALPADSDGCERLHEYIYYDVWDRFSAEILAPLKPHNDSLGDKFVDFRGVVLGVCEGSDRPTISLPFSREPDEGGTGVERKPRCRIDEFDQLWRFITCTQQKDTEFTVSRFLGSRAFYATALGNQPRAMLEGTGRPLCYLLYEDTLNDWQLGRLLYRVHRAGTARIAAIMHFDALRRANQLLTDMEGELEGANARLVGESDGDGDESANEVFRNGLRASYDFVETKFRDIAGLALDGTLESRIERSRYYVTQFAAATRALRIRRVSGFQRYDEFVTQRLGPVFEYIDSLGRKYARVQKERSILLGRIQTYDDQQKQEIISRAQRIADLALSCVLVPYYSAAVISHAAPPLVSEKAIWVTGLAFGLIMFFVLRYLGPLWEKAFRREPPAFLNGLGHRYLVAFILAIGLTLALKNAWPQFFAPHVAGGAASAPAHPPPPANSAAGAGS